MQEIILDKETNVDINISKFLDIFKNVNIIDEWNPTEVGKIFLHRDEQLTHIYISGYRSSSQFATSNHMGQYFPTMACLHELAAKEYQMRSSGYCSGKDGHKAYSEVVVVTHISKQSDTKEEHFCGEYPLCVAS